VTYTELLTRAGVALDALTGDCPISGIVMDSRKAKSGSLFVCMPRTTSDSHAFIPDAVQAGARAVLANSLEGFHVAREAGICAGLVRDEQAFRDIVWRLAKVAFDNPSRGMRLVGVTGTNGKTTTAWLVRDLLRALGRRAAYLGTLGLHLPESERELANTTPFSIELNELLAEARDAQVDALAMEVSSHALQERRADGVEFDVGVFTNLTQDHLDYHGTMEAYENAKRRLFLDLPAQADKPFAAALNMDDTAAATLALDLPEHVPTVRYWTADTSYDLGLLDARVRVDSIEGVLVGQGVNLPFKVRLGGSYNVENLLSSVAALMALGYRLSELEEAIPQVRPVPGRFEAVPNDSGIAILVDYAHTPDALEKLLEAVRPLTEGRVITVFGCGGDRDRTKRPKMAGAASQRSDITIVTSDNPRTEDPEQIIRDILPGLVPGSAHQAIADRAEAVAHAVRLAQPGDTVVIAGKGHENYQIIGRTKHHMDDRELARAALGGLQRATG